MDAKIMTLVLSDAEPNEDGEPGVTVNMEMHREVKGTEFLSVMKTATHGLIGTAMDFCKQRGMSEEEASKLLFDGDE